MELRTIYFPARTKAAETNDHYHPLLNFSLFGAKHRFVVESKKQGRRRFNRAAVCVLDCVVGLTSLSQREADVVLRHGRSPLPL